MTQEKKSEKLMGLYGEAYIKEISVLSFQEIGVKLLGDEHGETFFIAGESVEIAALTQTAETPVLIMTILSGIAYQAYLKGRESVTR